MTERERTERMLEECRAYDGRDKVGALMGELDCLVELRILEEKSRRGDEGRKDGPKGGSPSFPV